MEEGNNSTVIEIVDIPSQSSESYYVNENIIVQVSAINFEKIICSICNGAYTTNEWSSHEEICKKENTTEYQIVPALTPPCIQNILRDLYPIQICNFNEKEYEEFSNKPLPRLHGE